MKRFWTSQRGISLFWVLTIVAVIPVGGFALYKYFLSAPVPKAGGPSLVRGYLAVAVGRSARAEESGGIYAREIEAKDIYLPGVTVFLQDPHLGITSDEVRTDLSGRFTVQVPSEARYNLCWKSKIYGDGCLKEFISAGREPLFLSTVLIRVPAKQGMVASFGKVRFADNSLPRTLEPLSDINAFAIVSLLDGKKSILAEVPVNNFGYYLLPYLPDKDTSHLVARIEKAEGTQTILPDAYKKYPRLIQYHLTIKNSPPRLDAIVPVSVATGKRVQVGQLGDTVELKAVTRDPDGDPVQVQWSESPGGGTLSAKTGGQIKWTLPTAPGRYSVLAIASDRKGGYDRYTVRLSVGTPGVPFSGVVAGSDGTLIDGAEVEVNGKAEKTDGQGRFLNYVPEADRYVFNIRKPGYGFYSKIYDRSVAGGHWTLTRATVAEFDPTVGINFQDKRDERNCPGPDTAHINWNEGPALKEVWWQDGKGNNIPPPLSYRKVSRGPEGNNEARPGKPSPGYAQETKGPRGREGRVILPWQHPKRIPCGPGIAVNVPPNALQTDSGAAPTGKVEVSLATVDLDTPEQMPGDDSVQRPGNKIDWMQSYGAGSIEFHDKATGKPLRLKPGKQAEVTIPVDRSQLAAGAPLAATMPLLFYDEKNGVWHQDGILKLDAAKKNYTAKVKHFSPVNTDVYKTNPSCVRVQSSIPTPYQLEVTVPLTGGAAPKVKTVTITDPPPHVIYNLPNNTNITIVAIAPGSGTTPPRSLGIFIVNTGPPQAAGFGSPPPPSACATEVALSAQTFPQQPTAGLEFLHGLFSFSATKIIETDIGIPGTLSDQLNIATNNYYAQVDPPNPPTHPNGERFTFADFRTKNGFTHPPGFQLCGGSVCDNPDDEINVVYANSGDLGFGRDMHCRRTDTGGGTGFDYACYVTNYGDITTDDALDAQNARTNTGVVATVAMEYSRILSTDALTDRHVKFYVYNAAGTRVNSADLDSGLNIRKRPVPQLCMVCHGGAYPGGGTTGVPPFNTPDSVKLGSRFIPFDLRFFTFPAAPDKAAQQSAMKHLNEDIVRNAPSIPAPDPIADVVTAMYSGGSATQHEDFLVPGWQQSQLPNTVAQEAFYKRVISNACRTCHTTQPFANVSNQRAGVDLQFRSARDFLRSQAITGGGAFSPITAAEVRVCSDHVMPHAQRTHDIFWGQYWETSFGAFNPTIAGQFQAFGDTIKALPRPAGWPLGETWPPAWNGQLCGPFTGAGATPPSFYSSYVHILWSRNYGTTTTSGCTTCHADLSGIATDTRNNLLAGFFGGMNGPEVIPNNAAGSRVVQRLRGTVGARMPQGCSPGSPTRRCLNEAGGVYSPAADPNPNNLATEIDRVIYWISIGALP